MESQEDHHLGGVLLFCLDQVVWPASTFVLGQTVTSNSLTVNNSIKCEIALITESNIQPLLLCEAEIISRKLNSLNTISVFHCKLPNDPVTMEIEVELDNPVEAAFVQSQLIPP